MMLTRKKAGRFPEVPRGISDNRRVEKAKLRPLWLIPPCLASLWVILSHSTMSSLLDDSDTKVLLQTIRQVQDPLSWFTGDWPLRNHFYRPISTLFFELDNWLYGSNAAGYGLTNALIAAFCILAFTWLVREIMENWALAGIAGGLFGLWHIESAPDGRIVSLLLTGAGIACFVGLFRGRKGMALLGVFLVALAAFWVGHAYGPVQGFSSRVIHWLPGRTASVMTLFALASMACYARWERLSAVRKEPEQATSTERPFRASDPIDKTYPAKSVWIWPLLSIAFLILALGSYEQAIMLPGLLIGSSIFIALRGLRPRWWFHAATWSLLAGYFILRASILPQDVSGYQSQQLRSGYEGGLLVDLFSYSLPALNEIRPFITNLIPDPLILLTTSFWAPFFNFLGCLAAVVLCWRDEQRWGILAFWLMAFFSFLPMAWLKMFEHYHYWPSAFLSLAWALIIAATARAVISAVSPPAIQAPPRSDPAPGSLPHP